MQRCKRIDLAYFSVGIVNKCGKKQRFAGSLLPDVQSCGRFLCWPPALRLTALPRPRPQSSLIKMKPTDFHSKKLSLHYLKTSDFHWESPLHTPTTLTSFSFSSQELCTSQAPTHRHRTASMSDIEESRAKEVKCFHEAYLEFGMWPDMALHTQSDLKKKYRALRETGSRAAAQVERLKEEVRSIKDGGCAECEGEREKHRETKKALDDAMALSAALLKQVVELDQKDSQSKRSQRCTCGSTHTSGAL